MALSPSETTFIATHQVPLVVGMKPYLRRDQQAATGRPVNTVAPAVTGTAAVGQVLTCSTGTWLNAPTFTYQWRRDGVPISGATSATYTLVAADAGTVLSCTVTGTAGGGSVAVTSNGVRIAVPFAGPSATILSPVDNLIGEPIMADLIATFDMPVTLGSGLVYLKKTTDGSVVASWNAAYAGSGPGRMEVVGGTAMTMHMSTPLTSGVEYYVTWDIGIVVDASARPAAALVSTTAWSFIAAIPVASPEVYLDFAANTSLINGTPGTAAALLTTTRAGTAYADNLAGVWTSFAANQPRITNKGLLVEEARTNAFLNNSMTGAVPGTPGTAPTGWTIADRDGLSHTVVGTGTENGIDYVDIRIFGTTTSSIGGRHILFQVDTNAAQAAANGQNWTGSVFATLVGGSLANLSLLAIAVSEHNAGGTLLTSGTGSLAAHAGSLGQNRYVLTRTLNQATTAFVNFWLTANPTASGVAIDYTLRIGWPQLELGAFATSPIRTTGAALTRAFDLVRMTTPPTFGSAYTLYGAGTPNAPLASAANQYLIECDIGNTTNLEALYRNTAGTGVIALLGGSGLSKALTAVSPNAAHKLAGAFAAGDQAGVVDGGIIGTGSAAVLPTTPTGVGIGGVVNSSQSWDGYITQAAIWTGARLSNAQIQQVSMVGVTS